MIARRFRGALLGALTLAAAPAAAFDIEAMSAAERTAFRAEVRAYLLEHPEVLMEAIEVLESRQASQQAQADAALIEEHREAIFADGVSWVGGNPEGDITLVEFMDYRCGYCRRAHDEVAGLVESDGDIRLILKEFPILGEQSVLASRFAIATRRVAGAEAYEAVHDALMTMPGAMAEPALRRVARDLGLDAEAILAAMDAPEVSDEIRANRALAQRLGINGTPTFVLEDELLRGYVPGARMAEMVAAQRAE